MKKIVLFVNGDEKIILFCRRKITVSKVIEFVKC